MKKLESEKIADALKGELEAGRWKAGGKLLAAQLARCLKDAIRRGFFEPGEFFRFLPLSPLIPHLSREQWLWYNSRDLMTMRFVL